MENNEDERAFHRRRRPYWGLILIIIGVFALLVNFKIISGMNWDLFWPVLLIILGIMALHEYYGKGD